MFGFTALCNVCGNRRKFDCIEEGRLAKKWFRWREEQILYVTDNHYFRCTRCGRKDARLIPDKNWELEWYDAYHSDDHTATYGLSPPDWEGTDRAEEWETYSGLERSDNHD